MAGFYAIAMAILMATAAARIQYSQCCTSGCGFCDIKQPCGNSGSTDCSKNLVYNVCCADERKGRTQVVNITESADE